MADERGSLTESQVDGLWEKLQALYDTLPADEQRMLAAIITAAEGGDVAGYAMKPVRPSEMSVPAPPRLPKLPFAWFKPLF